MQYQAIHNYPYVTAHFDTETDSTEINIVPTAENIAALILNVGINSDVSFLSPEREVLIVSDYDNGIAKCFDTAFLEQKLLPALDAMRNMDTLPDVLEVAIEPPDQSPQMDMNCYF